MQRDRLPVVVHPSLWIQIHILTMRPESQGMQSRLQPDSSGRFLIAGRPPRSGWPRSSPSNQARIHISPPRFLRASSATSAPPRFVPPPVRGCFTDHRSPITRHFFCLPFTTFASWRFILPSSLRASSATSAPPRFVPPPARGCFTDHRSLITRHFFFPPRSLRDLRASAVHSSTSSACFSGDLPLPSHKNHCPSIFSHSPIFAYAARNCFSRRPIECARRIIRRPPSRSPRSRRIRPNPQKLSGFFGSSSHA